MSLFNIIYHESRHIVQHNLTNSEMDEKLYEQYKERIFRSINEGYYNRNYYGVTYEKDARMAGAEGILNFLKNHFPYLEKCIKYYEEDLEKEKQIEVNEKYFFELSQGKTIDEIMDKLLIVNPSIIDKYKELTREYNLDGTRISSINNKR